MLFLWDREHGGVELERTKVVFDEELHFVERLAEGEIGEVHDFVESREGGIELFEALVDVVRKLDVERVDLLAEVDFGWIDWSSETEGHAFPETLHEFVQCIIDVANATLEVFLNVAEGLVEEFVDILGDLDGAVGGACDGRGDQAGVGAVKHIDPEDEDLLQTADGQEEHGFEAVDGFDHSLGGQLVGALGHVVRHRGHGATHGLNRRTGRQSVGFGLIDAVMEVSDGDEDSCEHEEDEDGPAVEPDLRQTGAQPEVRSQIVRRVHHVVRRGALLFSVVSRHPMAAGG